jgi:hypothetical protein
MTKTKPMTDCWPTHEQALLLRAALLSGQPALNAWEQWEHSVDIDHLDQGSHRLLPLLYRNLQTLGVEHPLIGRFKGVYRRTWYENQLLFNNMFKVLRMFHDAGIKTMVLKGAALVLLYYKDYGLRPMSDFDLLVPTEQTSAAIRLLEQAGWKAGMEQKITERHTFVRHSLEFMDATGQQFDLHWHLLWESCQAGADQDFWDHALTLTTQGVASHTLNPAYLLLHTCVHGAQWNSVPPFRWIADAMMILNSTESEMEWDRLVSQAEKRRLTLPVREALGYLADKLDVPIPLPVMARLHAAPVSKLERVEYACKTCNYQRNFFKHVLVHWLNYSRAAETGNVFRKLVGFIKHLQLLFGLKHLWQLPGYAVDKVLHRITSAR